MNREYSDEEIIEIVKAFKLYMKKIVKHSAIDFVRMSKIEDYSEIVYSDLVDEKVSLSLFDDDAFFSFNDKVEFSFEQIQNTNMKNVISKLSKLEIKIWELSINGYSNNEISEILNIGVRTVENAKYHSKNILKKYLGGYYG